MAGRIVKDSVTPSLNDIRKSLLDLPRKGYNFWVSVTPIKTGNARKSTSLRGNTIHADYQYAVPLDQGRSRQAPQGMVKPTKEFLDKEVRRALRK